MTRIAALLSWAYACWAFSSACSAQIPPDAARYKRDLIRSSHAEWGLTAPVATFAAQVHQESGWRPDARSHVGATGIAQFMPATAKWIVGAYAHLGPADALNPVWALRAMVRYDRHLYDAITAATHCERMAKTLASYNGGLGNLRAEERAAAARGIDPAWWFGGVENVDAGRRSKANFIENRGYPARILFLLEPRYYKAGWGGVSC